MQGHHLVVEGRYPLLTGPWGRPTTTHSAGDSHNESPGAVPGLYEHWVQKILHGVPAKRVDTRASLSFALMSMFLHLSLATYIYNGYAPIYLVLLCSDSSTNSRVGSEI